MRRILILALFFLVFHDELFAQEFEPVRIELPATLESAAYHTSLMGRDGLLVFYESNELGDDGRRKWYFSLCDTSLNENWLRYLGLTNGLSYIDQRISENRVVMLFSDIQTKRSQDIRYEVVTYHIQNQKFSLLGGTFPPKAEVSGMSLLEDKLLIGLNLDNYQADILLFDLTVGGLSSLDTGLKGQLLVNETGVLAGEKNFIVAIKQFEDKRFKGDRFLVFDTFGMLRDTLQLPAIFPQYLGEMEFVNNQNNQIIIVGTYARETDGAPNLKAATREEEREAAGLFYLRFGTAGFETANFYDFADFPNIYHSLATEDLMRIRQQESRNKDKNKVQYIAFQFYKPKLIQTNGMLLFSAEAYRPQYRVESRIDYDFYGRPIPYTYTVFEGYQFFTSLLVSFDDGGTLKWSNDFKIRDLVSFRLDNHVLVYPEKSEIVSTMLQDGSLFTQICDFDGQVTGTLEKQAVALRFANDRLLDEGFAKIQFWYNNHFLLSGNQKIANNRLPKQNPRSVYFLQKVAFE